MQCTCHCCLTVLRPERLSTLLFTAGKFTLTWANINLDFRSNDLVFYWSYAPTPGDNLKKETLLHLKHTISIIHTKDQPAPAIPVWGLCQGCLVRLQPSLLLPLLHSVSPVCVLDNIQWICGVEAVYNVHHTPSPCVSPTKQLDQPVFLISHIFKAWFSDRVILIFAAGCHNTKLDQAFDFDHYFQSIMLCVLAECCKNKLASSKMR